MNEQPQTTAAREPFTPEQWADRQALIRSYQAGVILGQIEAGTLTPCDGLAEMERLAAEIEAHILFNPDRADAVLLHMEHIGVMIEAVQQRVDHSHGYNSSEWEE